MDSVAPPAGAFEFGKNWQRFLSVLSEERIKAAEASLRQALELETLEGLTFLDLGCGSGLFSLAARRLGATVHSVDVDPDSVACTRNLKWQMRSNDAQWTIAQGSALDTEYMASLGQFDIVYSWGVLHHTGQMWKAIENAQQCVREGGRLWIAIYNDQGWRSARWKNIKQLYNALPRLLRPMMTALILVPRETLFGLYMSVTGRPGEYLRSWTDYKATRGMSRWHDAVDWVGGWPFEVAKPEELFQFLRRRGFSLSNLTTCGGGLGCNELVMQRISAGATTQEAVRQGIRAAVISSARGRSAKSSGALTH